MFGLDEATLDGADELVVACDGPQDVDLCPDAFEICLNGTLVCDDSDDNADEYLELCDGSNKCVFSSPIPF